MQDFFATYPLAGTLLIVSLCFNLTSLLLLFLQGCDTEASEIPQDKSLHRVVHVWKADGSYEQRSFSRPAVKGGPWRQGRDGNEAAS